MSDVQAFYDYSHYSDEDLVEELELAREKLDEAMQKGDIDEAIWRESQIGLLDFEMFLRAERRKVEAQS